MILLIIAKNDALQGYSGILAGFDFR